MAAAVSGRDSERGREMAVAEVASRTEAGTGTGTESGTETGAGASEMLEHLARNEAARFKSQQRGDRELSAPEKVSIASALLASSRSRFLARFGAHLDPNHLPYFERFAADEAEGYDVQFYLAELRRRSSAAARRTDVKNRRYDALRKMARDTTYFTETEMMRREPLLYDQLVGQYMTEEEKKARDNIDTANITFVQLLMESIDRKSTKLKKREQQEREDDAMEEEEEDDDDDNSNSDEPEQPQQETLPPKWGEMDDYEDARLTASPRRADICKPITATERRLLKEEFVSIMYQNFLEGKDSEFDYTNVDDNEEYDNIELKSSDAEEKYFDSESPEETQEETREEKTREADTSEDELDVFMNRLNQHHSVAQLSKDLSNL